MPDLCPGEDEFRMPRRSPVEAALSCPAYSIAIRSGPESHIAFVESVLEKPSVKRSRAYRAEALVRLVGTCAMYSSREKAAKAGWELLRNGIRYAHEGYYAAKQLFGLVGVTHPSLELIQRGREMANRRGVMYFQFHDLLRLSYLELCIRATTNEFDAADDLASLAAQVSYMQDGCKGAHDFAAPMLTSLVANGVHSEIVRTIAESAWSELAMYRRFQGTGDPRELAAVEAIIDSLPNDEA